LKLSQQSILRHSQLSDHLKIEEPIVFDGLENFAESQYNPNNINQAIGKNSYFIYDFSYAPMNRKGTMSPRQHGINLSLEKNKGRHETSAIRKSTADILRRLFERKSPGKSFVLYSDKHFQYRKAIQIDLKDLDITHITISSKDTRNYQNHLFAINHADLLIRQYIGAFSRETICFSKTAQRMVGKYALFAAFKNYMRPIFVKKQKKRPETNVVTPAMELGITSKILQFHEFFDLRRLPSQVKLHTEFQAYHDERLTYTRQLVA
jgi:hypothetical protein